jgi:hypothetical protein
MQRFDRRTVDDRPRGDPARRLMCELYELVPDPLAIGTDAGVVRAYRLIVLVDRAIESLVVAANVLIVLIDRLPRLLLGLPELAANLRRCIPPNHIVLVWTPRSSTATNMNYG